MGFAADERERKKRKEKRKKKKEIRLVYLRMKY